MSDGFLRYVGESAPAERVARPLGNEPLFAIIGTALATVAVVASSWYMFAVDSGAIEFNASLGLAQSAFVFLAAIAGYVTLCRWMQAVRTRLVEVRQPAPPTWKIWWGWIIPFYNLGAPYVVMRDLRARVASGNSAVLTVWWTTWLAGYFIAWMLSVAGAGSDIANAMIVAGAVTMIACFVCLVPLIRSISASLVPHTTSPQR